MAIEHVDEGVVDRLHQQLRAALDDAKEAYALRFEEKSSNPRNAFFREALRVYIAELEEYVDNFPTYDPSKAFTRAQFAYHHVRRLNAAGREEANPADSANLPLIFVKCNGAEWDRSAQARMETVFSHLALGFQPLIDPKQSVAGFLSKMRYVFNVLAYIQEAGKLKTNDPAPIAFDLNNGHQELHDLVVKDIQAAGEVHVNEEEIYTLFYVGAALLINRERGAAIPLERVHEPEIQKNIVKGLQRIIQKRYSNPERESFSSQIALIASMGGQVLAQSRLVQNAEVTRNPKPLDYKHFKDFAGAHFPIEISDPRVAQVTHLEQRAVIAMRACEEHASVMAEPLDADVSLDGKTDCKGVRRVHLIRGAAEGGSGSNLACRANVVVVLEGVEYTFTCQLDGKAFLTISLQDKTFGRSAGISSEEHFFLLELRRIMIFGLQDHLVRQSGSDEKLRVAGPSSGLQTEPRQLQGSPTTIRPRGVDGMFVVSSGDDEAEEEAVGSHSIPAGVGEILNLLGKTIPITKEDLETFRVELFQEEVRGLDGNELKIYVPIPRERYVAVLEELRTGALGRQHLFLQRQRGVVKRSGYQPWKKKDEPAILYLTQRRPSEPKQDALRTHLTKRGLGVLEKETELQFFLLATREAVRMIRIRYPEDRNGKMVWIEIPLLAEDVALMKKGARFEEGLSDGAGLIDEARGLMAKDFMTETGETLYEIACVLQVAQAVHYVQGSYVSLEEAASAFNQASRS